jgi:hypothetical protein
VNFKYNYARQLALTTGIGWTTNNVKLLAVNANYVPNEAHQYVSQINPAAIVARTANMANKTATDGFARGSPVTLFSLLSNSEVEGVILYIDSGDDATSVLLAYVDDGIAFPFMPLGFDYAFAYDSIEGGFFRT